MSDRESETIALIERLAAAFNRGDFKGATAIAHPDVAFVRTWEQTPLKGRAALRKWMEPDAFRDQRLELRDITVQGDKVLVHQHLYAKGAESGIDMDVDSWAVWTIGADGVGTRLEIFLSHEEAAAREAAGLAG